MTYFLFFKHFFIYVFHPKGLHFFFFEKIYCSFKKYFCKESCSIILFDTSLTCFIALRTFVRYSICSQSSSLSTGHMRKHDDITHASAWLKSHCSTLLNVFHFSNLFFKFFLLDTFFFFFLIC